VISRYLLATTLAILSIGLASCGGGGEEGQLAEPGATEPGATEPGATEQPTVAALPTIVLGTPTITGNLFEFEDKGYSVRFPEGWTPEPNFLPGPQLAVDAFFAPDEVQGMQPNIAVTCETLPEGMDLKEYFDRMVDVVRQIALVEPEVSSREVSGQEALVSSFTREDTKPPLKKIEVFFVTERCGWSVALTSPLGGENGYEALFDEFLDSFKLLP
jgi:hypothetical protein